MHHFFKKLKKRIKFKEKLKKFVQNTFIFVCTNTKVNSKLINIILILNTFLSFSNINAIMLTSMIHNPVNLVI